MTWMPIRLKNSSLERLETDHFYNLNAKNDLKLKFAIEMRPIFLHNTVKNSF